MTYLDWLADCVCDDIQRASYQKLFSLMFDRPYYWFIDNDINRASDGENLRNIFANEAGVDSCKDGPCSVLEMFVALAIRCENELMYDPDTEDKTGEWFWIMMENLGLDQMTDDNFSYDFVDDALDSFMDRTYCKDGNGGPFYIPGCRVDLRKTELWYQLNYYLQVNFPI